MECVIWLSLDERISHEHDLRNIAAFLLHFFHDERTCERVENTEYHSFSYQPPTIGK